MSPKNPRLVSGTNTRHDTLGAIFKTNELPCSYSRDQLANRLSGIEIDTKRVSAHWHAQSGHFFIRNIKDFKSLLKHLHRFIADEETQESLRLLDAVVPDTNSRTICSEMDERSLRLIGALNEILRMDENHREDLLPGAVSLFSNKKVVKPETYRMLALQGLFVDMFGGEKPAATDDGPFFRFVGAAFKHWGLKRPTQTMVRRHLERFPPQPRK
jgi:hypothetical protein